MIYEFTSRATGNMVMTQPVAERLLKLIGKHPGPQGIITVAEMPGAIAQLKAAIAAEKSAASGEEETDPDKDTGPGLAQRAFPMIELLERAHAGDKDVTWGA